MGDVYVVAEHFRGSLSDVTFELLGKAKELAGSLGGNTVAVLAGGPGVRDLASSLGAASRVLVVEDAGLANYTPEGFRAALSEAIGSRDPRLVLIANTSMGMDLAAGLSASTGMPLVAYCHALSTEGSTVVATSRLYGGKVDVEVGLDSSAIVSVQAGAFPADAGRSSGAPEIEEVKAPAIETKTRFVALIEPEAGDVDITRADVLVSVGRGIQNADNLEIVQELADALGAPLSASRPVTDAGWLPKSRQVGKSGLTVKPKLYLCVGISGAPEHLEGMRDADLIIAINTDEHAPIFDVADYGVTADLFDIVPALTDKLK